jgi:hypothetical protein
MQSVAVVVFDKDITTFDKHITTLKNDIFDIEIVLKNDRNGSSNSEEKC